MGTASERKTLEAASQATPSVNGGANGAPSIRTAASVDDDRQHLSSKALAPSCASKHKGAATRESASSGTASTPQGARNGASIFARLTARAGPREPVPTRLPAGLSEDELFFGYASQTVLGALVAGAIAAVFGVFPWSAL